MTVLKIEEKLVLLTSPPRGSMSPAAGAPPPVTQPFGSVTVISVNDKLQHYMSFTLLS